MTRKAVHENTLQILRKAQEESSKIALYQHERALLLLSTQTTSQSTQIFDREIKRLLAHLSRCEGDNLTLRDKINELEAGAHKLKTEVPERGEVEALKRKLGEAVDAREEVEREIDRIKRELTCDERGLLGLIERVKRFEDGHVKCGDNGGDHAKIKEMEMNYAKMLALKNREILAFKVEMDSLVDELRLLQ
jgi:chromosome segregation ATPase